MAKRERELRRRRESRLRFDLVGLDVVDHHRAADVPSSMRGARDCATVMLPLVLLASSGDVGLHVAISTLPDVDFAVDDPRAAR